MIIVQPQIITQGDYGAELAFTLLDGNGNPINLTGLTLTFLVQAANDPTDTLLTLSGNPMTVDNATAGTCHYTVAQGDFPNTGIFNSQVQLTRSGFQETIQGPQLIVQPVLPKTNN
jgi:hypothetical protein